MNLITMKLRVSKLLLFVPLLFCLSSKSHGQNVTLQGNISIYTSATVGNPVYKALVALQKDIQKVTGFSSTLKPLSLLDSSGIVIANAEIDTVVPAIVGSEAHKITVKTLNGKKHIVLQGADKRGTIYSIYTFCEKILGVPPLWYYSSWVPQHLNEITVADTTNISFNSPYVKYRVWFPNDTDLLNSWRKESSEKNTIWLETALRLKMNTFQWFEPGITVSPPYGLRTTPTLIKDYGFIATSSHHSPLNASLNGWNDYWTIVRDTISPALLLANEGKIEEYMRYNIETIHQNNLEFIWMLSFRGLGDYPFWETYADAPTSDEDRGAVISSMMQKQHDMVLEITGDSTSKFKATFYDEMAAMTAAGYIVPPLDTAMAWTYIATRRDHYPNVDVQGLPSGLNRYLGYYFNMQFTSTGSHLAAGEGPHKMEQNFRYIANKSNKNFRYSMVNAGNIREFLMELSANATMMWDFPNYNSDNFLIDYCKQYFGDSSSVTIAALYKKYYNAYWQQKQPDLTGFDRQYIFQDLRYKVAIKQLYGVFNNNTYNPNPFFDLVTELQPGRTFNIVPADNGATNQVDAVINGTTASAIKFAAVVHECDSIYNTLSGGPKLFFNDNLRAPAYFMYQLNESLLQLASAYKLSKTNPLRDSLVLKSVTALKSAQSHLLETAHGNFSKWYAGDDIFNLSSVIGNLNKLLGILPTFGPGNLAVLRAGDGTLSINTTAVPLIIQEYRTSGVEAEMKVTVPSSLSGNRIVLAGNLTTNGALNLSADGKYLSFVGYDAPLGSSGDATLYNQPKVIVRIDSLGTLDKSTRIAIAGAMQTRGVVSDNGSKFWVNTANSNIYVPFGNTETSVPAYTTLNSTSLRSLNILDGNLYGVGTGFGKIGTGLPTSSASYSSQLAFSSAYATTSAYGFVVLDMNLSEAGPDVIYVTDQSANTVSGLRKFSKVSGTWVSNGAIDLTSMPDAPGSSPGILTDITGNLNSSGMPELYAIRGSGNNNSLISISDGNGYNQALSATVTHLHSAGNKMSYKGVAFTPNTPQN